MTEIGKAIGMGIVEGITEWLPISSTGHLLLFGEVLRFARGEAFTELFLAAVHIGAILAVMVRLWERMRPAVCRTRSWEKDNLRLWGLAVIGSIPGAAAELLFGETAEAVFFNPLSVAAALIVFGAAFLLVEHRPSGQETRLSVPAALEIGCMQVLSLIPGTSRSGSTILGARLLGIDRQKAAEFSFFLAVPAVLGKSGLTFLRTGSALTAEEAALLAVGAATAFLVSLFVVKKLMAFLRTHSFSAFGWYRIGLGAAVLAKLLLQKTG